MAELCDLVNKICILEDQRIRCTCIILVCQHYKGYSCFILLPEELYVVTSYRKSTVCVGYTLICASIQEKQRQKKVVEFIKSPCNEEDTAILVRYFENPPVGNLLLTQDT